MSVIPCSPKQFYFFTFLFFLQISAVAEGKGPEAKCLSCHIPSEGVVSGVLNSNPMGQTDCVRCHVNLLSSSGNGQGDYRFLYGKEEILGLHRHKSLANVPALDSYKGPLSKFDPCGLIKFLKSPVPRRFSGNESMFPLTDQDIKSLGLLKGCQEKLPQKFSREAVAKGEKLFHVQECINCHGPATANGDFGGVRLRLGHPLLSKTFFKDRLKGTKSNMIFHWVSTKDGFKRAYLDGLMPGFAHLNDDEMDSLYAYVSTSTLDLPVPPGPVPSPIKIVDRKKLFNEVKARVFDTSCRHCHKNSTELTKVSFQLFGGEGRRNQRVPLPNTKTGHHKSSALADVLSPGPACEEAEIVQRLKVRRLEWSGKERPLKLSTLRGMPLIKAPLSEVDIMLMKDWTELGCPTESENLCRPCRKQ